MSAVYIDTSILGAYYCPEPLSDAIETMMLEITQPVVSVLSELEFASLLSKKKRLKDLTATKAQKVLLRFKSHIEQGYYQRLALNHEQYMKAGDIIADFRTSLRTLDALHLALVLEHGLQLFTADKVLASAARKYGVVVIAAH